MFPWPHRTSSTLVLLCLLCAVEVFADSQRDLRLINARDQIEGSFTTAKTLYADKKRIYLASYQGDLFVLARDRAADFPVLQIIRESSLPLTGVTGDRKHLYVTSFDGYLRVYRKTALLQLVRTERLATYELGGAEVIGKRLYVARGTRAFDVNRKHVFLGELNPGDVVLELGKKTLAPMLTYGEDFVPQMTVIFDRRTAQPVMALPNPVNVSGQVDHAHLKADEKYLFRTVPGCCGRSVEIYHARTFELLEHKYWRASNVVARRGRWLLIGDELGRLSLFDLGPNAATFPAQFIERIDLRQVTGHSGPAAIEVRALWSDRHDNLVFAASSWGNDLTRGPDLPAFFVFKLSRKQQDP